MSPALGQWTSEEIETGGENGQMDLPMSRAGQEGLCQDTCNPAAASLQREKGCVLAESQAHRPSTLSGQNEHLRRATPCLLKKQ